MLKALKLKSSSVHAHAAWAFRDYYVEEGECGRSRRRAIGVCSLLLACFRAHEPALVLPIVW